VRVLVEASSLVRSYHLEGRNICGSKQDSRCVELECAYECQRYSEFSWIAGCYQRFIEGFSKITKPMTELLEKDWKFKWTPACEANFQELKKRLTTALVLVMQDMEKPFYIYCDASGQGLGCVLMQDGHMVAYAS
jgi:hypothetical protein